MQKNSLLEVSQTSYLPSDFYRGEKSPHPILFSDQSIAIPNESLEIAYIDHSTEPWEVHLIKPYFQGYMSNDELNTPIFREHSKQKLVSYFPLQRFIVLVHLDEDSPDCRTPLIDDINLDEKLNADLEPTDCDFFYVACLENFYFFRFFYDKRKNSLLNRIYSLKYDGKSHAKLLEEYESANRPLVHQNEDGIVFGMLLNFEIKIRVELKGVQNAIKLIFNTTGTHFLDTERRIERLVNAVGLVNLSGSKYLFIFYNNDLLQSGFISYDLTRQNQPQQPQGNAFVKVEENDVRVKESLFYWVDYDKHDIDVELLDEDRMEESYLNVNISGQFYFDKTSQTIVIFDSSWARYTYKLIVKSSLIDSGKVVTSGGDRRIRPAFISRVLPTRPEAEILIDPCHRVFCLVYQDMDQLLNPKEIHENDKSQSGEVRWAVDSFHKVDKLDLLVWMLWKVGQKNKAKGSGNLGVLMPTDLALIRDVMG